MFGGDDLALDDTTDDDVESVKKNIKIGTSLLMVTILTDQDNLVDLVLPRSGQRWC